MTQDRSAEVTEVTVPAYEPLDRRLAWWTLGIALAVLAVMMMAVPWDWTPGADLPAVAPTDVLTPAEIARAEDFARGSRVVSWSALGVSVLVALLLGLTPRGAALMARLGRGRRWPVAVIVGTFAVLLIGRLAVLPFGLVQRQRRLDVGLTRQDLAGWLRDWAVDGLVTWVLTSLLLLVLIGFARRSPRRWCLGAGGVAASLVILGSLAYPVVVEPLFNSFTPLAAGPLRDSLLELAEQEDVAVDEVLVADASRRTTTLNAYVSGFGGTRRIVLYDNLLQDASSEEVRSVVAHELSHAHHDDVLTGTRLGAVGVVAGIAFLALLLDTRRVRGRAGYSSVGHPTVVPAVLALVSVGTLLFSPVQNGISRAIEARADRDALEYTNDPGSFIGLQTRLSVSSLADPTPPRWSQFWFGSHPTMLQRVGLARLFEEDPWGGSAP